MHAPVFHISLEPSALSFENCFLFWSGVWGVDVGEFQSESINQDFGHQSILSPDVLQGFQSGVAFFLTPFQIGTKVSFPDKPYQCEALPC